MQAVAQGKFRPMSDVVGHKLYRRASITLEPGEAFVRGAAAHGAGRQGGGG
jgi:hypothetical protein